MSRLATSVASTAVFNQGERGGTTPDNTMKNIILILFLGTSLLGGCAVYLPDDGPVARPQGGPGNGFCPPGQAKKGNC